MTTHHVTMELDIAIKKIEKLSARNIDQEIFADEHGNCYENRECLTMFYKHKAAGMIYVPVCDNVDERGMCKGHEDVSK